MNELTACGLPGPDYIVRAPNATLDGRLNRPAQHQVFSRALHLHLMVHGGETPDSAIEYTPHGCRHVQVTAGTQMASQGLLADASLECLGHWETGSKMPRRYDAATCVAELQTRMTISDVLRTGWRPAADGSPPMPATRNVDLRSCPGTPAPVPATGTPTLGAGETVVVSEVRQTFAEPAKFIGGSQHPAE